MERDKEVALRHVKQQRDLLDKETVAAQEAFQERVTSGRILFVGYKMGVVTQDTISGYPNKTLSRMLLDLVALIEWTKITQEMFCEWKGDLSFLTDKLSDAMYLRAADKIKDETATIESEEFVDLICLIAFHKLGGEENMQKLLKVCQSVIVTEMRSAKYIKSKSDHA